MKHEAGKIHLTEKLDNERVKKQRTQKELQISIMIIF
jgi:hypothetical protein